MRSVCITIAGLLLCLATLPVIAAEGATVALKVGIKEAPPFVIKNADGIYSGISIELWQQLARDLNLSFEYVETDLNGLLRGLENGSLDASVAALTVTAEREQTLDFSHPFHTTGLAIAVDEQGSALWATLKRLLSVEFLASLGALVALLMLVGFLLWLAERHKNQAMFGGRAHQGIGASFWWAAVTMTTVGYGDKTPITFWGRAVALIWMFTAIIIISSFTAAIATSLTLGRLESSIRGVNDLADARVGTLAHSVAESWLDDKNIDFTMTESITDALRDLDQQTLDAVVYDKPILQYELTQMSEASLKLLPNTFLRQDYAIALAENSHLREPLNQALLQIINTQGWQEILRDHLGNEL